MKFYDTCALLNEQEACFKDGRIIISSITFKELENIKQSANKSEETKYRARKIVRYLKDNRDKYIPFLYNEKETSAKINQFNLPKTDDSRIILSALSVRENLIKDLVFVTDDLLCAILADSVGLKVEFSEEKQIENYTGFLNIELSNEELGNIYNNILEGTLKEIWDKMLLNQYLIPFNDSLEEKELVAFKKTEEGFIQVSYPKKTKKKYTMHEKPEPRDIYQMCALDSINSNQITVLRGEAGTGKSFFAIQQGLKMLEDHDVSKIVMFINPVATKDSCQFGFLPGTILDKILDSQIGVFLSSKLGAREGVLELIEAGMLELLPVADIRGYDTSGMNAYIYVTEAQNTTKEMMKLMVQRIGEDSKVVIEGDTQYQVDCKAYMGANNGLVRLSEVFRGFKNYGEVELQKCYRSEIAEIASKM